MSDICPCSICKNLPDTIFRKTEDYLAFKNKINDLAEKKLIIPYGKVYPGKGYTGYKCSECNAVLHLCDPDYPSHGKFLRVTSVDNYKYKQFIN